MIDRKDECPRGRAPRPRPAHRGGTGTGRYGGLRCDLQQPHALLFPAHSRTLFVARSRGDWRSGSALRSHRRGHWFEPSIAHPVVCSASPRVSAASKDRVFAPRAKPPPLALLRLLPRTLQTRPGGGRNFCRAVDQRTSAVPSASAIRCQGWGRVSRPGFIQCAVTSQPGDRPARVWSRPSSLTLSSRIDKSRAPARPRRPAVLARSRTVAARARRPKPGRACGRSVDTIERRPEARPQSRSKEQRRVPCPTSPSPWSTQASVPSVR